MIPQFGRNARHAQQYARAGPHCFAQAFLLLSSNTSWTGVPCRTFTGLHSELSSNLTTFMQCCDATFFSSRIRSCQLRLIVSSMGRSGAAAEMLEWVLGFHQSGSARGDLEFSAVDHTPSICAQVTPTDFLSVHFHGSQSHSPTVGGSDVCFSFYFLHNLCLGSEASENDPAQSELICNDQ